MKKVNVAEKLSLFEDYWNPRIVGQLNGQHIKIAKIKGEFVWHKHDDEDEMFFVIEGKFSMEFRDKTIQLDKGEFLIVPRGTEHKPVANEEASIMLFEPETTLNTGNSIGILTREKLESL